MLLVPQALIPGMCYAPGQQMFWYGDVWTSYDHSVGLYATLPLCSSFCKRPNYVQAAEFKMVPGLSQRFQMEHHAEIT